MSALCVILVPMYIESVPNRNRTAVERYYCNFGVNPKYIEDLTSNTLRAVGSDSEGDVRVLELSDHPFYVGTLFVPQSRSTQSAPHPLVTEFVRIVAQGKAQKV